MNINIAMRLVQAYAKINARIKDSMKAYEQHAVQNAEVNTNFPILKEL